MNSSTPTLDLGAGLVVRFVPVASLREQNINAQVMQPADMTRLTENIRERGQLESLPYCYQPNSDAPIEIVSGHHRVRAARAAGLTEIPVIVDTVEVPDSTKVARQIAHNQLHGSPDQEILKQLVAMITDVDDLLLTGLPEDWLPAPAPSSTSLSVPNIDFDWSTMTIVFLPPQMNSFREAVAMIERGAHVGVAQADQYAAFARAANEFSRFASISSMATAISVLTDIAAREVKEMEGAGVPPRGNWKRTAQIIGPALPPETANTVQEALNQVMEAEGIDDPAEALRRICARATTEPGSA